MQAPKRRRVEDWRFRLTTESLEESIEAALCWPKPPVPPGPNLEVAIHGVSHDVLSLQKHAYPCLFTIVDPDAGHAFAADIAEKDDKTLRPLIEGLLQRINAPLTTYIVAEPPSDFSKATAQEVEDFYRRDHEDWIEDLHEASGVYRDPDDRYPDPDPYRFIDGLDLHPS